MLSTSQCVASLVDCLGAAQQVASYEALLTTALVKLRSAWPAVGLVEDRLSVFGRFWAAVAMMVSSFELELTDAVIAMLPWIVAESTVRLLCVSSAHCSTQLSFWTACPVLAGRLDG